MTDYAALLTGQHVRLWPYTKTSFPADTMAQVCLMLNQSGMAHKVFWEHAQQEGQTTVDLTFFLTYMDSVVPLLVQGLKTGEIVGLVWFNNFLSKHRANINLWYRRRAWGHPAREATVLATRYAFTLWELRQIWGFTPWPEAMRHVLPLGYKLVATLPDYACIQAEAHPLYLMLRERDL